MHVSINYSTEKNPSDFLSFVVRLFLSFIRLTQCITCQRGWDWTRHTVTEIPPSVQFGAITIRFHHTSLVTLPRQHLFQEKDTIRLPSQDQHPSGIQQEEMPLTKHSGTSWGFLYFHRAHKIWLHFYLKSIFTLFSFRKMAAMGAISFVKCIKLFSWIIWNNRYSKKKFPYQLQRKIGRNEKNS